MQLFYYEIQFLLILQLKISFFDFALHNAFFYSTGWVTQKAGKPNIRILQLNMRGTQRISGEVSEMAKKEQIDILLMQDPYAKLNKGTYILSDLGGRNKIRKVASRSEKPFAAVAVCNSKFDLVYLEQYSNVHCTCAQVLTPHGEFIAISHYFKWKQKKVSIEPELELRKMLYQSKGRKIILGMDCNSESWLWSPINSTVDGHAIENLIERFQLQVINRKDQGPTFRENGRNHS